MSKVVRRRFYRLKRFWLGLVLAAGAVWVLQGPVLSGVADFALEVVCARSGYDFSAKKVEAGLWRPLVVEGLGISSRGRGAREVAAAERVEIQWRGAGGIFSGRFVEAVAVAGLAVSVDLRPDPWRTASQEDGGATAALGRVLGIGGGAPDRIRISDARAEVVSSGSRWVLDGVEVDLDSVRGGEVGVESLALQAGGFGKVLGPLRAAATWKDGALGLSGLEFFPGVSLREATVFFGADGISSSLVAAIFGGSLRGDVRLHGEGGRRLWDVALVGSGIGLGGFPALLDWRGKADGRLAEGRFTFRGEAGRPADAEASLRVLASDFRWNDRGWESLEIAASLIHRRLLISNFDFRQGENSAAMNGEVSVAEGWGRIAEAPFLWNLRADVREPESLAGLLGVPVGGQGGSLSARGSVSGRAGSLDGFAKLEAAGVVVDGVPLEKARAEVLFKRTQAELVVCELKSGKDRLEAGGTVGLAKPHGYSAKVSMSVRDAQRYFELAGLGGMGGAASVNWRGSGTVDSHYGAFEADVERFVSPLTPAGLTGRIEATYSPENVYFPKIELRNGGVVLKTRATLSGAGVILNDTELESRAGTLLTGAGFFPVDPFPVMAGKDWRGAVQGDGKVYLRVATPGGVDLAELARVAGQDYPVAGKLRMEAEIGGTAADLSAKGWVKADGFAVGAGDVPKSVLDLAFEAGGGAADVKGRLETRGSGVVAAAARFPVGFSKNASGAIVLVDPAGKIEASVDFPRADLALLRPFFPKLRWLDGEATGSLKISNTVSEPRIDGSAEIVRAGFRFGILPDEVEVVGGRFVFESDKARLENVSGAIGGGRFEMKGACSFARASEPEFEAAWNFERVPVHDDPGARLFVGGELASAGGLGGGLLGGRIDFVDSRINGRVALDFGLGGTCNTAPALGAFAWMVGEMAAGKNWALDVAVGGGPIRLGAQGLRGELLPAMRLRGTAGEPLPTGRIAMSGVSVDAAVDGSLFFDGNLDFLADAPWDPFVTASARGWVNGSEAGLFAFGPLSEGRWMPVFAQDGAKPQEVFLLLSQGLVFSAGEGLAPVDFRAYGNRSGVAGMRVARDTAWSRGIRFGESLDMALRGPVMPMESFLVDYSWRLAPEF